MRHSGISPAIETVLACRAYTVCKKCLKAWGHLHHGISEELGRQKLLAALQEKPASYDFWVCVCHGKPDYYLPIDLDNPALSCEIYERTGIWSEPSLNSAL
jgi:hypothetical protein